MGSSFEKLKDSHVSCDRNVPIKVSANVAVGSWNFGRIRVRWKLEGAPKASAWFKSIDDLI